MKHKSKKINDIVYSTKKSELIKEYKHKTGVASSSYEKFLYKTKNGLYFFRIIDFMCDRIVLCTENEALAFINKVFTLF